MTINDINTEYWGITNYNEAWQRQQEIFNAILETKRLGKETTDIQRIVYCQHQHVYTLGKHGKPSNMLVDDTFLKKIGATFVPIDRGGDITYHGPGQLVGYPILDIENFGLSLKAYIDTIEESVIRTMREYGIETERLSGATGVWIDKDTPRARKICAIGVRASRYVTMHGFALNINTDLKYFSYINPCGFVDKGATSMQQELGRKLDFDEVRNRFDTIFKNLLLKK